MKEIEQKLYGARKAYRLKAGEGTRLISFTQWLEEDDYGQTVLVQQRRIINGQIANKEHYVSTVCDEQISKVNKMKTDVAIMQKRLE